MAMIMVLQISRSDFVIDISKLKDLSAIVVLLIPFVGFVVGYFVECITAGLEHGWYALGFRRPSKNILNGSSKYIVADIDKIPEAIWRQWPEDKMLQYSHWGNLADRIVRNCVIRDK